MTTAHAIARLREMGSQLAVLLLLALFAFVSVTYFRVPGSMQWVGTFGPASTALPPGGPDAALFPNPRHRVVSIDGERVYGCITDLAPPPIYRARHRQLVDIVYEVHTAEGIRLQTTTVLLSPPEADLLQRLLNFALALLFLSAGVAGLLVRRSPLLTETEQTGQRLVSGLHGVAALVVLYVTAINGNWGPTYGIYALLFRLLPVLAVLGFSRWPVDTHRHPVNRALLGITVPVVIVSLASYGLTTPPGGCRFYSPVGTVYTLSLLATGLLVLVNTVVPLAIAQRQAADPYWRAGALAQLWAATIALVLHIGLGFVPTVLGLEQRLPAQLAFSILGLLPLTFIVIALEPGVVRLQRFMTRGLLGVAYLGMWGGMTAFLVALTSMNTPPSTFVLVLLGALPALLFSTVLYTPFTGAVGTVLYGYHARYSDMLDRLYSDLTQVRTREDIIEVLTLRLPGHLRITRVGLWFEGWDPNTLRVYRVNRTLTERDTYEAARLELWDSLLTTEGFGYSHNGPLQVFRRRVQFGGYDWYAALHFIDGNTVVGVALFGPKAHGWLYFLVEHGLMDLTGRWLLNILRIERLHARELEHERRAAAILSTYEQQLRSEFAADLHDKLVDPLAYLLVQIQGGADATTLTSLSRNIIAKVRQQVSSRIQPYSQWGEFTSNLRDHVRQANLPEKTVTLAIQPHDLAWARLSARQGYALYYIIAEALKNAYKAARHEPLSVAITCVMAGERYTVTIEDDGPGFDPVTVARTKDRVGGLQLMHARARGIQATFSVESDPSGTRITVSGPVDMEDPWKHHTL